MHSNTILSSSLLDIIFENRNKDYGSYVLRRDYNKRLMKSLIAMLALIAMFAIWILQKSDPSITRLIQPDFTDTKILPPPQIIKPATPRHATVAQVKHASVPNNPPVIVPNDQVNKIPPTNLQILTSVPGEYKDGPPSDGSAEFVAPNAVPEIKESKLMQPEKEIVVASPEVLPQFPGGLNALMKFLKRNLNAPQEIGEGEEIAVRVRFIVNYNGSLAGFTVLNTGGEPFDNEVIRVLKKMPKWIPGKTNGENVSAYFIIPVKFRVSD